MPEERQGGGRPVDQWLRTGEEAVGARVSVREEGACAEVLRGGGWGAVEPSGRMARFSGVNIFRFENGKVSELWNHRDDLRLMQQVGAPIYAGARPEA